MPGSVPPSDDDLVAIWRSSGTARFQNYRARFTVIDAQSIERSWITALFEDDDTLRDSGPPAWKRWISTGQTQALRAEPILRYRTKQQQVAPATDDDRLVQIIRNRFRDRPTEFERCAVELWRFLDGNVADVSMTRPSRDGGRDAVGTYAIGPEGDTIAFEFALEAKCYSSTTGVGVRDVARLVSRLRYRQFGVLVTTSWVDRQAYQELRDDGHPVVVICAADIAAILKSKHLSTPKQVETWLDTTFGVAS